MDLCIPHGLQGCSCFPTVLTTACRAISALVLGAPPPPFCTDHGATMLSPSHVLTSSSSLTRRKAFACTIANRFHRFKDYCRIPEPWEWILSGFHAGQSLAVFLLWAAQRWVGSASAGAVRCLSSGRAGKERPLPSSCPPPALLPAAWLAGGGQVGRAHCRPCWDGSGCSTSLHPGGGASPPMAKKLCAVLIFFLNRSSQRHFHLSNWASSISILEPSEIGSVGHGECF